MRPKGFIALFVILIFAAIVAYLLSDKFIERGIEKAGEAIVGARVEVHNLNFSLLDLSISLDRLQVTNPNDTWKNLFETSRMSFDMELSPLSRKKVIINDITVADIRIGTKRKTDGKIPKKSAEEQPGWVKKAKETLMKKVESAPILNLDILKQKIDVESLFASFNIQSLNQIEQAKLRADSTNRKWQKIISEFDPKQDLTRIESEINEIKSQEIKGLDNLVTTLEKSKRIYNTLNDFKKDITQKKQQATEDFQQFTTVFASIDNWIADDFDALKSKANLGEFTPKNVATMLFGKNLTQPIMNLLPYIGLVRKYMPVAQKLTSTSKVEKPPRFAGQNIRFPLRHLQPNFLIEEINISGASNQEDTSQVLHLSGEVHGITSHPRVYGKPLAFQLMANLPQSNAYQLRGEIDHTTDIPAERFQLQASGIRVGEVHLPTRPYLPTKMNIKRGNMTTNLNFIGDQLDFRLELTARPVSFSFPDSLLKNDVISKVTTDVFNAIDLLKLSARIKGAANDLSLAIDSNIDNILAQRINGIIGESAKAARAEIHKKLNAMVTPKKQEALALVNNYQNQINSEIKQIENGINEKLSFIDEKKKEIE
ncbi:MAG: TIGR03545 family protein [bacterium]